jgi:two-component system sensor histidine kinase KdpD
MMASTMALALNTRTADPSVPLRRRVAGAALATLGLPALTVALLAMQQADLATALLCYLTLTMVVATIGGLWPSLPTAVAGYMLSHWYFTPPFRTWTVDRAQDLLALGVFLAVSIVVSILVQLVARRAGEAARAAAHAEVLAEGNRLRTALLSAVSHDLRTPLATIKAWLTGLLEGDVTFTPAQVDEILAAAVDEVDRLNTLVGNLLDMSRLQTGAVTVHSRPLALDAVTSAAVDTLPHTTNRLLVDIPDTLPHVQADEALLERVVANLVDNALRHTPDTTRVEVIAHAPVGTDAVELRVVDHGPGVNGERRGAALRPLGESGSSAGAGLGLAVAKGLTEALRGHLVELQTPGGGTTMQLTLRAAQ